MVEKIEVGDLVKLNEAGSWANSSFRPLGAEGRIVRLPNGTSRDPWYMIEFDGDESNIDYRIEYGETNLYYRTEFDFVARNVSPDTLMIAGELVKDDGRDPWDYEKPDMVNHPPHYTRYGCEVIEITEHLTFNAGNAVKYIARAPLKGNEIQDLEKAAWYINREIERLRKAQ